MTLPNERRGPQVEIKRGVWQDRLREIDAAARAARAPGPEGAPAPRWALLVEPAEASSALVDAVKPLLGEDPFSLRAPAAPLQLSALLPELKELHAREPFLGVCVVGTGNRADARKAGWDLGPLADLPWIFAHPAVPPSGLVPTVGEKVARYLEIIEGLAFMEGPKETRR